MYLQKDYFNLITSAGHHILNTIPMWPLTLDRPWYGATGFDFFIYCKHMVERRTLITLSKAEEPVIVIGSMTSNRPIPFQDSRFGLSVTWVAQASTDIACGAVCVSREAFIMAHVVKPLARINGEVTLKPRYANIIDGGWEVELSPWVLHFSGETKEAVWRVVKQEAGTHAYQWEYKDEWVYEHEDSIDTTKSGLYSTLCSYMVSVGSDSTARSLALTGCTRSYLDILTIVDGVLEIRLRGSTSLKAAYKGLAGLWGYVIALQCLTLTLSLTMRHLPRDLICRTTATAHWNTSLVLSSSSTGMKVEQVGTPTLAYRKAEYATVKWEGRLHFDPEQLLRDQLPNALDLSEVANSLRRFERIWRGCYPGFSSYELTVPFLNANGDLLFALSTIHDKPARMTPAG